MSGCMCVWLWFLPFFILSAFFLLIYSPPDPKDELMPTLRSSIFRQNSHETKATHISETDSSSNSSMSFASVVICCSRWHGWRLLLLLLVLLSSFSCCDVTDLLPTSKVHMGTNIGAYRELRCSVLPCTLPVVWRLVFWVSGCSATCFNDRQESLNSPPADGCTCQWDYANNHTLTFLRLNHFVWYYSAPEEHETCKIWAVTGDLLFW